MRWRLSRWLAPAAGRASGSGQVWIADGCDRRGAGQLRWLAVAALAGFLLSYLGVGLAALPRDWFVLVHLVVTGTLLAAYGHRAGLGAIAYRNRWPGGLAIGAVAAAFAVGFVLSEPASPGPEGVGRVLAVVWPGAVYGLMDGLLLSVLPVHAVYCTASARGRTSRWPGRVATAIIALAASLLVTCAYHLGFPEFRGTAMIQPVIGNGIFTLAYILSGSPLAPLVSHVALHVAATLHSYGTSTPLPPHY